MVAHLLLASIVLGAGVLGAWPPERVSWYPACPFASYLHILCPGCGATRAFSALLRGRLREALRDNPLFVALLPLLLAGAVECYRRAVRGGEFRWPQPPAALVYGVLAGAAMFMAARNGFLPGT